MERMMKKADLYMEHWAEIYAVIFAIIGFLVAVAISEFWWNLAIVFGAGILAGRLVADAKEKGMFPYWLAGFGMMIGMVMGSRPLRWYNVIIIFQIGWYAGWKLYNKGYLG